MNTIPSDISPRRGEVPFVAIRVGRSNDPREVLGLARELRVHRATALGYLALWEELILEVGDASAGRVRGYTAIHLSAKLGWTGSPRKLVEALKRAGVLTTHRGVFAHPYWEHSPTGIYSRMRSERREAWRLKKRDQRAGDVPGDVQGTTGGRLLDVQGKSDTDRSIDRGTGAAPPPPPPPQGGGELAFGRWDWIRKHHKRPRNSQACKRLLGAMTDENWALCQWVIELAEKGWPRSLSRKKRVASLDSHRFLATEAFLELLPEWDEKLRPPRRQPSSNVEPPTGDGSREAAALTFLLAQLADADLSEADKHKIRGRWADMHPDNPAPWSGQYGHA